MIACRYLLELSEEETAAALGVRRGTVKSRLSRALARLRETPGGGGMSSLEQRLQELGRELAFPPEPDLARAARAAPGRPFPWRWVALAAAVVALAAAFAVPQARTSILRFFHIRGATVERVETLPAARSARAPAASAGASALRGGASGASASGSCCRRSNADRRCTLDGAAGDGDPARRRPAGAALGVRRQGLRPAEEVGRREDA